MSLLLLIGGTSVIGALAMVLTGALLVGSLKPLVRHSQKRQLKKVADVGLINGIFGHHRAELREEGILNSTSGYDWLVKWNAIEDIKDVGRVLPHLFGCQFLPDDPFLGFSRHRDATGVRRSLLPTRGAYP
jgi:hypothetical protein